MFIFSETLRGDDFYVTRTGSDGAGNSSHVDPWHTINHALAVLKGTAVDPHTIHVAPGTYSWRETGEAFPRDEKLHLIAGRRLLE